MTTAQRDALGADVHITQINGTVPNVHVPFETVSPEKGETEADLVLTGTQPAFKELCKDFDVVAIVAPIGLAQQILAVAGTTTVIQARNKRVLGLDGKATFVFEAWERLVEVKILTAPWGA